jgi:hypothetical protein
MSIGIWIGFIIEVAILAAVTTTVTEVVTGIAIASFGRMRPWIGVVACVAVPIFGALVVIVIALVRASRMRKEVTAIPQRAQGASVEELPGRGHRPRVIRAAIVVLLALALLSTLLLRWLTIDIEVIPRFTLWAWGTGIDLAVLVSAALLFIAAILTAVRPSRWGAVTAAIVGSGWTFVAGSALLLLAPLQDVARNLNNFSLKPSDIAGWFGVQPSTISALMPTDPDLASTLRHVGIFAEPSLYITLGVGITALIWALLEVGRAHRRVRARLVVVVPDVTPQSPIESISPWN